MSQEVNSILEKLDAEQTCAVSKVALAFSGGLDSSLAIELLRRVYDAQQIVAITVDIGQGDAELDQTIETAQALGVEPIVIPAQTEFTSEWLPKAIVANSNYGGYPVSTSMTRQLIAKLVAHTAKKVGCDAVMEGSTGKGNDQYRMHNVFKVFAPELKILVPVRDLDLSRAEETALCHHWGVPVHEALVGGDDKTLWARSIASGALGLNQAIPDHVWMWRQPIHLTPDSAQKITLQFERGQPIALNGKTLPLNLLIDQLNQLGGRHGIGLIDICEDGIMGLKSREIYEAPGAHIILKVHQDIEGFCLTKEELLFKSGIDQRWGELVYHGMWFHPLKSALDAFIDATQSVVNGTYTLKLYKGNIEIVERQLPTALFNPEVRGLGGTLFDQRACQGAAKIRGLPFELLSMRGRLHV